MPVEIVTIVNSSGKIISNGKHIVSVLKEAKAVYEEKKAAVRAERAIRRSQTYDIQAASGHGADPNYHYGHTYADYDRRTHHDDAASYTASHKSYGSKHSRSSRYPPATQSRPALTVSNLRTHSEVSSVKPSKPPSAYRSPYAETAPGDMVLSRPNLSHAATMPLPTEVPSQASAAPTEPAAPQRSRLEIALVGTGKKKKKEIDMNLAYGSIPPDLADRVDLDPVSVSVSVGVGTGASTGAGDSGDKEETARTLVEKIEDLLTEAQCVHHTATHIIEHLQSKPEAAAAVALALAELSTLLGKMSPSFLGVIKGGSPAIFALLASPQFLIAAGLTVGVTVVMFGGWKIIKRIQEAKEIEAANRAAPLVFEAQQQPAPAVQSPYPASEVSGSVDEALVVEEELSTIETWRRGITPFGEDQSADLELISPEADRAIRSQYGDDDTESVRTSRTQRSSKSHKSHKSHRSRKDGEKGHERKSSRLQKEVDDTASEASSHRSHRSHTSSRSHHSHRSEKTERSSKPKRSSRTEIKAIEDGSRDKENSMEAVLKPKKDNMLKTLFKKKKRVEEGEHGSSVLKVR